MEFRKTGSVYEPSPRLSTSRASGGPLQHTTESPAALYTDDPVHTIYFGDNLDMLRRHAPDGTVNLVYIDPPFNTGKAQSRTRIKTVRSASGDRVGFQGQRYATAKMGSRAFADRFDDYLAFLEPRLREAYRALAPDGTLYFLIEIIWAYDYGGRPTRRWPPKHDNILVYVKDPSRYVFDTEAVERIPYMAPGLVGPEKAARGKLPTDTWWHTIVPTNGRERTGYPTQKPLGVVSRIVRASSRPGDLVLDFFAGSGTTGEACLANNRRFMLVDDNPEALEVMARRFKGVRGIRWVGFDPRAALGRRGAASPVA